MSFSSTTNRISYTGNGAVDTYAYTFKVFEDSHLLVTVRNTSGVETTLALTTDYTVTGVGASGGGNVVLVNTGQAWLDGGGDLLTDYNITIRRVVPITQETDIRNQGSFYPEIHEDEFDKLTMIDLQQQDEVDRSIKLPETLSASTFDPTFPATLPSNPNAVFKINADGDGFEIGPTSTEIENAESYATAASASASAAALSETAAGASETAAAASASSAAAVLASAYYRDVLYKSSADSPITIASDDNGKLFVFDSSGGAISVTLPQISTMTPPFNIAAIIRTAGNNVTFNRSSTDTIMGATSKVLSVAGVGSQFVLDTGASPDDWTVLEFGSAADLSITTSKLAANAVTYGKLDSQIVNSATAVTAVLADSILISDASDSGNFKKALVSTVKNAVIRSVTTTDTATTADETLLLSGSTFTQTLFTASGNAGKILNIVHAGTSLTQVYTIDGNGSETIDGALNISLYTNGESVTILSDGSNWLIIDHYYKTGWVDDGTMTITATTTNPTKSSAATEDKVRWRRDGQDAIINYCYRAVTATSAAAGSGDYLFALPTNLTIDTSLITSYTTVLGNGAPWKPSNVVGHGIGSGNTDAGHFEASVYDSTKVRIFFVSSSAQSVVCHTSNQNLNIANLSYNFEIRVPMSGWLA